MYLNIALTGEEYRSEIEDFIHKVFTDQHGANIKNYLPWLLGIYNKNGDIQSALGLKGAQGNPLFLEQYLNSNVEKVASQVIGKSINREDIIEVGNLAAISLGGARVLTYMLTAFLRGAGYKWVVFTAPPLLNNSFKRLGLSLQYLADAKFGDLNNDDSDWGSYYNNNPQVVIGNVDESFEILKKSPNLDQVGAAMVWNQAYAKGWTYRVAQNNLTSGIKV